MKSSKKILGADKVNWNEDTISSGVVPTHFAIYVALGAFIR